VPFGEPASLSSALFVTDSFKVILIFVTRSAGLWACLISAATVSLVSHCLLVTRRSCFLFISLQAQQLDAREEMLTIFMYVLIAVGCASGSDGNTRRGRLCCDAYTAVERTVVLILPPLELRRPLTKKQSSKNLSQPPSIIDAYTAVVVFSLVADVSHCANSFTHRTRDLFLNESSDHLEAVTYAAWKVLDPKKPHR